LHVQLPASTAIGAEVDLTDPGGMCGLEMRLTMSLSSIGPQIARQLTSVAH
jgi:hypothetical protein